MAMTQPTVTFGDMTQWLSSRGSHAITMLGTIATDPTVDPSIQGGYALVAYDQVANELHIDAIN